MDTTTIICTQTTNDVGHTFAIRGIIGYVLVLEAEIPQLAITLTSVQVKHTSNEGTWYPMPLEGLDAEYTINALLALNTEYKKRTLSIN